MIKNALTMFGCKSKKDYELGGRVIWYVVGLCTAITAIILLINYVSNGFQPFIGLSIVKFYGLPLFELPFQIPYLLNLLAPFISIMLFLWTIGLYVQFERFIEEKVIGREIDDVYIIPLGIYIIFSGMSSLPIFLASAFEQRSILSGLLTFFITYLISICIVFLVCLLIFLYIRMVSDPIEKKYDN